jgi:hypothetical protein
MKTSIRLFECLLALFITAAMASPANAISVGVVGDPDKFLTSTALSNSGIGTVEAWVSGFLGFAVSIDYKNETTAGTGWQSVDGNIGQWAHSLVTDPPHYVLRLGVGKSGADTHYLFENIAELSWAVIDLSEMLAGQTNLDFNFGRISHIGETGGMVDVSEPRSIGLLVFGLGLFSTLILRRRRPRKAAESVGCG